MIYDRFKGLQVILGNKLDADMNNCLNDGISELTQYLRKNVRSVEQYQALFRSKKEIPSLFVSELKNVTTMIDTMKERYEGVKYMQDPTVLDPSKSIKKKDFGESKTKNTKLGSGFN